MILKKQDQKLDNIVIIDSNFILLPSQFKVDYFNEINSKLEGKTLFIIFKQVLDELEAKKKREPNAIKFQKQYELGLSYLEKNKNNFNIHIVDKIKKQGEKIDDFLLRNSVELKKEVKRVFLATNDKELRIKAKTSKVNLIFLRQKKFLDFNRM